MRVDVKIDRKEISSLISKPSFFLMPKRKVIKIDLMYMLYYVFDFRIELKNNKIENKTVCVDCLTGEHAVLKNIQLGESELSIEENESFKISIDEAERISRAALMSSLLYEKRKGIEINQIITKEKLIMEYPYWIGYYRRKKRLDFEAVDAVSGSLQGAKMKPTFIKLIMQ